MDSCVAAVIQSHKDRAEFGLNKYGTTVADNPLSLLEWLQHLQEELMDAAVYVERLKRDVRDNAAKAP